MKVCKHLHVSMCEIILGIFSHVRPESCFQCSVHNGEWAASTAQPLATSILENQKGKVRGN